MLLIFLPEHQLHPNQQSHYFKTTLDSLICRYFCHSQRIDFTGYSHVYDLHAFICHGTNFAFIKEMDCKGLFK
jgi:hypothetical protein